MATIALVSVSLQWPLMRILQSGQDQRVTRQVEAGQLRRIDVGLLRAAQSFVLNEAEPAADQPGHDLWVFSDPTCTHCRDFEPRLDQLQGVRVHIVALPRENSKAKVSAIMCSSSPRAQWNLAMAGPAYAKSATPVVQCPQWDAVRNARLADTLGVDGTPFLINERGEVFSGEMPVEALQKFATPARGVKT
jgi:hypothetical protein